MDMRSATAVSGTISLDQFDLFVKEYEKKRGEGEFQHRFQTTLEDLTSPEMHEVLNRIDMAAAECEIDETILESRETFYAYCHVVYLRLDKASSGVAFVSTFWLWKLGQFLRRVFPGPIEDDNLASMRGMESYYRRLLLENQAPLYLHLHLIAFCKKHGLKRFVECMRDGVKREFMESSIQYHLNDKDKMDMEEGHHILREEVRRILLEEISRMSRFPTA